MKIEVGMTLYAKKIGNDARYLNSINAPIEDYISKVTVKKVGRKYFYLDGWQWDRNKFDIKTLCEVSEYSANVALYLSEQDIYDEAEAHDIADRIWGRYSFSSHLEALPLETLRAIEALINDAINNEEQEK